MGSQNSRTAASILTISLKHDSTETISEKIFEACTTTGTFFILDHGLEEQTNLMMEKSKAFFSLDKNYKMKILNRSEAFRCGKESGYDTLLQRIAGDVKEFYTIYCPDNDKTKHLWVPHQILPNFMLESHQYYYRFQQINHIVLKHMATALNLDADHFASKHTNNSTLRYHHYPALLNDRETVLAHTDWGSITFLVQDTVGGLFIFDKQQNLWTEIPLVPNAICVMCGDLMNKWTEGAYHSPLHKVVGKAGEPDRFSIAYFVRPDEQVVIGDTTVEEYARMRKIPKLQQVVQKVQTMYS
jgi:isopenicillin N synthase-like dioxygenase